jgi:DNA-binding transcriptional regulator YiaG
VSARLAKKFAVLVQGVLESLLMHGRKDQKNANESGNSISGELDEQALTRDLKRFVEESELSIPKIASEMGVFSATLSMWIAGTTKPSRDGAACD